MTHFGTRVLEADPSELADRLSRETGVKVIAARDGMTLEIDKIMKD
jgi:hypothetical protein